MYCTVISYVVSYPPDPHSGLHRSLGNLAVWREPLVTPPQSVAADRPVVRRRAVVHFRDYEISLSRTGMYGMPRYYYYISRGEKD